VSPSNDAFERARETMVAVPGRWWRAAQRGVFYDVTRKIVEVLAIVTKAEAAGWLAEHGAPGAPGGAG
jgi:hypothetical protein